MANYHRIVDSSCAYETRYMQEVVSATAKTHQLDAPVTGTAVGLQQRLYSLRLCEALRRWWEGCNSSKVDSTMHARACYMQRTGRSCLPLLNSLTQQHIMHVPLVSCPAMRTAVCQSHARGRCAHTSACWWWAGLQAGAGWWCSRPWR